MGVPWRFRLTFLHVAALLAVVGPLSACGGHSRPRATAAPALSFVIQISDNRFTPYQLTVPRGTSVTWRWSGRNEHSVVGDFGTQQIHSAVHRGSGSFTVTMADAGTWHYECGVYGPAMSGTVVVN